MKVAVTAVGPSLDDEVDPRFGRCAYFVVVDPGTMESEAIENASVSLGHGAGIQSAQVMSEKGVEVVLTGNCGPNAFMTLSAAGIQVILGVGGSAREAVEQFKSGALSSAAGANVAGHFGTGGPGAGGRVGMGMGPGMGMGRGTGRRGGMGRGMGMGRGRGMGMGAGMMGGPAPGPGGPGRGGSEPSSKTEELGTLKSQAQEMQGQLEQIMDRIKELEG